MKNFIQENLSWQKITILTLVLTGAAISLHLYSKDEKDTGDEKETSDIIWRVAYINTNLKMQDYIHSTTENGCRCGHMPYMFSSKYLEMPRSAIDSSAAIKRFYDFKDKETYVVYEAYPYCKTEDWKAADVEDDKLLTIRSTMVDTWSMCQRFGLIDSVGHYTQ